MKFTREQVYELHNLTKNIIAINSGGCGVFAYEFVKLFGGEIIPIDKASHKQACIFVVNHYLIKHSGIYFDAEDIYDIDCSSPLEPLITYHSVIYHVFSPLPLGILSELLQNISNWNSLFFDSNNAQTLPAAQTLIRNKLAEWATLHNIKKLKHA